MLKRLNHIHDNSIIKFTEERRNNYVHYISLSMIIGMIIPIVHNYTGGFPNVSYFLVASALSLFALFLMNKNALIKNSLSILIFLILIIASGLMFFKNGARNNSVIIYPSLLFISSLTYDRRVVYVTLCCSLIAIWLAGMLEIYGVLSFGMSEFMDVRYLIDLSVIFIVTAFAVDLLAIDLTRNLNELNSKSVQLLKSNQKLEESHKEKDKFFSIIAHDLRSPFQGILGISDILTKDCVHLSKDDLKEFTNTMNKALHNQYKLMTSLLDWSRIQTGRMKYFPTIVNAYESVMEAFYQIGSNAFEKKLNIKILIDKNCEVFADFDMLTMIFRNLISNAIKFSYPNNEIVVKCYDHQAEIIFVVIDYGMGIDEIELQQIFKLDNTIVHEGTAKETGTGLGLIICSEIIEKHGCKIWAESMLGKGSIFYFTMCKSKDRFKFTKT